MSNFYKTLEVSENASQDEIKKSYRKLSLLYHPDKNMGNSDAELKFKIINEAYQTLGDIDERKQYDMKQNNPFFKMNNNPNVSHPENVDNIFKMFFGSGMSGIPGMQGMPPGMQGMPPGMHGMPPGMHGMPPGMQGMPGNIRIFKNGQSVNINNLNKPPPIIKNVSISMEQSYNGANIPIQIDRWLIEDGVRKCENETVYLPIPKGIDNKEIIILRDSGNVIDNNTKGDIKIIITIENASNFKREGLNLIFNKTITLKESLCGFTFIINHISGKQLRFNSDTGNIIKDNLIKSIPNHGMERDNYKGNLNIKFTIDYPSNLSSEQIEQLEKIL